MVMVKVDLTVGEVAALRAAAKARKTSMAALGGQLVGTGLGTLEPFDSKEVVE